MSFYKITDLYLDLNKEIMINLEHVEYIDISNNSIFCKGEQFIIDKEQMDQLLSWLKYCLEVPVFTGEEEGKK